MMFLPDEGYESNSSLSDDMQNSSSDESYDARESASSALICAAIEATHSSGYKWIRSDEDESEIRQFADILATLSELPVVNHRRRDSPGNSPVRGESVTVKSVESAMKKKRRRTSPEQLRILESFFVSNKMPSQATRQKLAENLGMSSRRVQIWFQNKRAKLKRTGKDCDSERDSLPGSPVNQTDESRYALFRLASEEMHRSAVVRSLQPFYGDQQPARGDSFVSFYGQPIFA